MYLDVLSSEAKTGCVVAELHWNNVTNSSYPEEIGVTAVMRCIVT